MADWIIGNFHLTRAQSENNGIIVYETCMSNGWTVEAVSGMLGNMSSESGVNPGIFQSLKWMNMSGGFGLTQWTPATKYINWAGANWYSGDREMERIFYEVERNLQWFSNPNAPIVRPPLNFKEFTQSTESPETLANYFLWYYEHPAVTINPARGKRALEWYEFLYGRPYSSKRESKIWMMTRRWPKCRF